MWIRDRIEGGEFSEKLQECYDRYGRDETIVITRSNKRANRYNEGIRRNVLVIALGGNALGNTPEEQLELVKETASTIVDLVEEGLCQEYMAAKVAPKPPIA